MLNRFRAVAARRGYWGIKGERGGGLVRFVNDERVVPVAGITKGY
jgi:hypothetical protein